MFSRRKRGGFFSDHCAGGFSDPGGDYRTLDREQEKHRGPDFRERLVISLPFRNDKVGVFEVPAKFFRAFLKNGSGRMLKMNKQS